MVSYEECMEAMRAMGRSHRFFQRHIARQIGLEELPGYRVYVDGVEVVNQPEKLSEWLPGEQDWVAAFVLHEAIHKAGLNGEKG